VTPASVVGKGTVVAPEVADDRPVPKMDPIPPPEILAENPAPSVTPVGGTDGGVLGVVTRPMLLPFCSTNQRAPSGPGAIHKGLAPTVGTGNSLKVLPSVVMRPMLLAPPSVNHMAPSGPVSMPTAALREFNVWTREKVPEVVTR